MSIIEKVISIIEFGSGRDKKTYTEEQMASYANFAYFGSIVAFFFPILIIVPFHYAPKAKKSTNIQTVNTAKRAEKISLFYLAFVGFTFLYMIVNN